LLPGQKKDSLTNLQWGQDDRQKAWKTCLPVFVFEIAICDVKLLCSDVDGFRGNGAGEIKRTEGIGALGTLR
jgi:hypothetical protein